MSSTVPPPTLLSDGWFRFELSDGSRLARRIDAARRKCAREFHTLMAVNAFADTSQTGTGQYGFTADGNESSGEIKEIRSHLVIHQSLPDGHPLAVTRPLFYGDAPPSGPLADAARELNLLLDLLTLDTFEELERGLGLAFGTLAGEMALGERLLRFQWYPALGDGAAVSVRFGAGERDRPDRVVGAYQPVGAARPVVRAAPHEDIGHWTWQVYASEPGLRFWREQLGEAVAAGPGPWLYGNTCAFLRHRGPRLISPVHWVDVDEESARRNRLSISYFAHARPTVPMQRETAGEVLYDRLIELGYLAGRERSAVHRLLSRPELEDGRLLGRLLADEAAHGVPAGYSAGVSRYYVNRQDGQGPTLTSTIPPSLREDYDRAEGTSR